jgi:TonB family protein
MRTRTIIRVAVLAAVAGWIASATLAQQDNHVLAKAFPKALLVSHDGCTAPAWPLEARRYEIEGVTLLHFRIGEDGIINSATVAGTSSWKMLDDAALASVQKCRFKPGLGPERAQTYALQIVWAFDGPPSSRPQLIADSCAPSARFAKFQPYNRNATTNDGVLLRFLVSPKGEPLAIKAETDSAHQEAGAAAAAYVKTCRFAIDPSLPGEKTDTVFGRVLATVK